MSRYVSHYFVRGPCAWLARIALVASFALACGVASAQTGSGPGRIDEPPAPGNDGSPPMWQDVAIPILPAGASLGAVWAKAPDQLYVWALVKGGADAKSPTRSVLLHRIGTAWSVALDLAGEAGASVFGNCTNDVFAATSAETGEARLYHFNGIAWSRQALPDGTLGPAGAIVGKVDDVLFRTGYDVLRYDGRTWQRVFVTDELFTGGLAYVSPTEIYANCTQGHCSWNGAAWCQHYGGTFRNVSGSWGTRPYDKGLAPLCEPTLTMYAVGQCDVSCAFSLWRFAENAPGSMDGLWTKVPLGPARTGIAPASSDPNRVPDDPGAPPSGGIDRPPQQVAANEPSRVPESPAEPPQGGTPVVGDGVAVWGSSPHDVYATGVQGGNGLLYHFDGIAWHALTPLANMPPIAGIAGTGPGDVWLSFANGRLLHYTGGSAVPDPEVADPIAPAVMSTETSVVGALETRVVACGRGSVSLEYAVPRSGPVHVNAYDVAGRCVGRIESAVRSPGRYIVSWSTRGLPHGVYFCLVRTEAGASTQRVLVMD